MWPTKMHLPSCKPDACAGLPGITVARDGGACPTIQDAIECLPSHGRSPGARFEIRVLPGVYSEQVVVNRSAVSIIGLSAENVTLRCTEPNSPTLTIDADDVRVESLTVLNDANGYAIGKNYALYVGSGDRAAFYRSHFYGAQDTVYTGRQRAYFKGCVINGTSDFLYGEGSAVWDECTLLGEPGAQGWSFLTAHSGNVSASAPESGARPPTGDGERSAYLVRNSRLPRPRTARLGATWLGRPWGVRATVIYANVWMDEHINKNGWGLFHSEHCSREATSCLDVFYAEYNSTGPGAAPEDRVRWSRQLTADEAAAWTPQRVLRGWEPPA